MIIFHYLISFLQMRIFQKLIICQARKRIIGKIIMKVEKNVIYLFT